MKGFLLVAAGGALGSAARYGVGLAAAQAFGTAFPWGTLIVNILGGLALGFLAGLALAEEAKLFLGAGVLGGFTTFSAFSVETLRLAERGFAPALGYVAASVILALAAAAVGMLLAGARP